MAFTPTPDQAAAESALYSFLLDPKEREFRLAGPGGVGKSFLISRIVKDVLPDYEATCKMLGTKPIPYTLYVTATTNKAAEVLEEAIEAINGTANGITDVTTIHSYLKLKLQDNYQTGESELIPAREHNPSGHYNHILIIDEASMIDGELMKYIQRLHESCKIIYVGDDRQLAPVGLDISPVYEKEPDAVLSTPVRNTGKPGLQKLNEQLRETVKTGIFHPISEVPGEIELLDGPGCSAKIQELFSSEIHENRVLAYTNERVDQYNQHIRSVRGYSSDFQEGEILINGRILVLRDTLYRVDQPLRIHEILDSTPQQQVVEWFDKKDKVYSKSFTYRRMRISPNLNTGAKGGVIVQVPENRKDVLDIEKATARAKAWAKHFSIKKQIPLLRFRDSQTVYKSQGSSYDEVILDMQNLLTSQDRNQLARMLYVGASRTRKKLWLFNQKASS